MWTDTHLHLDPEDNHAKIFQDARANKVTQFLVLGTSLDDCQRIIDLADPKHGVYVAAGLHPHVASTFTDLEPFKAWHKNPACKAVGEIGLDYHYDFSPRDQQRKVFELFLDFAVQIKKPPVIHCRNAFDDCYDIVKSTLPHGYPFLIHSFADDKPEARKWLDLGATLSFNGIVTFNKAQNVRNGLAITPLDKLLIETDAPYLAPIPYRGKRNQPAYIPYIAQRIADEKFTTIEDLARITTENANRFFAFKPQK